MRLFASEVLAAIPLKFIPNQRMLAIAGYGCLDPSGMVAPFNELVRS